MKKYPNLGIGHLIARQLPEEQIKRIIQMANNRMYLVCNKCGGYRSIAKSYGDGWFTQGDTELNPFFEKHDDCHTDGFGDENTFALVEECDKDYFFDFVKKKITKINKKIK